AHLRFINGGDPPSDNTNKIPTSQIASLGIYKNPNHVATSFQEHLGLKHLQIVPLHSSEIRNSAATQLVEVSLKMNEFTKRSERVKSVDFHPTEPWILTSLYSGNVHIWNYRLEKIERSFEVTQSPDYAHANLYESSVRSAKFIASEQWIITGADDAFIRLYSYNTGEKIIEFEAHKDYIRCLAVHPTLPYVLSASDDNLIKLWDWEKDWKCIQTFKGHSHYVMQVAFKPRRCQHFRKCIPRWH
ncbi:WD40 repeat, partial [Dillenia turbinata]